MLRRRVPLRRSSLLLRGLPPKRFVPIRKNRPRPRRGPERCPDYLAWIRTLGCVVCSRVSGGATVIEASHTNALGSRGLGQKTSDFAAIPLCSGHHRKDSDSYHVLGEKAFSEEHGIDLKGIVLGLVGRFKRQTRPASAAEQESAAICLMRPIGAVIGGQGVPVEAVDANDDGDPGQSLNSPVDDGQSAALTISAEL